MPRRLRNDSGSATTPGRPFVTADVHPCALPPRPWEAIRARCLELGRPLVGTVLDVVESILECGGDERLIGGTSMFDLHVAPRRGPGPVARSDVLTVHTIGSRYDVAGDEVLMRHVAPSGLVEEVRRPADAAVPLFWRLATEKWDIAPWRWEILTDGQRRALEEAYEDAAGPRPSSTALPARLDGEMAMLRRVGLLRAGPSTEADLTPEARRWFAAHSGSSAVAGRAQPDPG